MKVILEFEGTGKKALQKFEKALLEYDDQFDLIDSIIWELDYGTGESEHPTKYGNITIRQQM